MTKKQKAKFIELCKECGVKPNISKYYEMCHKTLVKKIHSIAKTEGLHDGYYWLIDAWILEYNRESGTTQYAHPDDLKVGMADINQNPIDFLYDRLSEIKKYRKKGWKKINEKYDDY